MQGTRPSTLSHAGTLPTRLRVKSASRASPVLLQRCAPSAQSSTLYRQELKRKLESAEDSDIVEQGKATIKSVKKELRLLQKAEEDAASNESARYTPLHPSAAPTPMIPKRSPHGPHPQPSPAVPMPQVRSRPWSRS